VIQIEIFAVERAAAVLARVLVPLEDVVPGKFDFLFRKPVEYDQQNHARDANAK
jgi:hypothetical protein